MFHQPQPTSSVEIGDDCPAPRAWPQHIGIINDYVRIPYANGSSFASQFLYRAFRRGGQRVTIIGPHDPDARPEELPRDHLAVPSLPLRNHPGVYLGLPAPSALRRACRLGMDIVLGQSGSCLMDLGVWLRQRRNIPFLCVNTVRLASAYNVMLPDALNDDERVTAIFREHVIPQVERWSAEVYNQSDGLIVLAEGLKSYWRERGVTVPIHVIPRSIDPNVFQQRELPDPFPAQAKRGQRLLCVCRQTREKGVARLLDVFARHVLPRAPEATLTLVGDGPDYDSFVAKSEDLMISRSVFFMGERSLMDVPAYYQHADLFTFMSLSETYGQVVSEAMWCGAPVVALDDDMGVAQQIDHNRSGVLVAPGPDAARADWRFGNEIVALLRNADRRCALAREATLAVRRRARPEVAVQHYYQVFEDARERRRAAGKVKRSLSRELATLVRWGGVQSGAFALGLLRSPAIVNRRGERQPSWELRKDRAEPQRRNGNVVVRLRA